MKETPILFTPANIRAILDGRKGQTRRVVKKQPETVDREPKYEKYTWGFWNGEWPEHGRVVRSPYGNPGDRLWVREGYMWTKFERADGIDDWLGVVRYRADSEERRIYQCDAPTDVGMWPGAAIRQYEGKNRSAIFMPKWAARLWLEITDVRVERVQDISEADAIAEGVFKDRVITDVR